MCAGSTVVKHNLKGKWSKFEFSHITIVKKFALVLYIDEVRMSVISPFTELELLQYFHPQVMESISNDAL